MRARTTRAARPKAGRGRLRDRFELLVPLGRGGFGTVWEGFDMLLERPVAIKELRLDSELTDTADALREARATARLNHPAIVSLYEVINEGETIYMINELVRGYTLSEMITRGQLSDNDAGRIGYALCEALGHAHQQGVVHRDVKPANVMVSADWLQGSGGWRVQPAKLMDFGIASIVDPGHYGGALQAGPHAGSRGYVAPEQEAGEPATPASDVYSLALTLFECFTGAGPGKGRRSRLARQRRDLPQELTWIIDACLEPEPTLRPTVEELGQVLYDALPELSHQLAAPTLTLRLRGLFSRRQVTRSDSYAHERPAPRVQPELEAYPLQARFGRLAAATLAAGVTVALTAAAAIPLSWPPPLLAAVVVFLMPRAGWALALAAGATALAFDGQVGAAIFLIAPALIATLAAIMPLGRVTDAALAGAGAFGVVLALQAWSGHGLVLALPDAVDESRQLRQFADVALHSLAAFGELAYLASFGLWALAAAAAALLAERAAPLWAWAGFATLFVAAQIAIGEVFARAAMPGFVLVGAALSALLIGAAFLSLRRGRVFAQQGAAFSGQRSPRGHLRA